MSKLLVYGSLLHPEELARSDFDAGTAVPVAIKGFRREFTQEPMWRVADGVRRAVLNVVRSSEDWLNGVVLSDVTDAQFERVDEREAGYHRISIPASDAEAYGGWVWSAEGRLNLYMGRPERRNLEILPNPDYLELCVRGAQSWGRRFHRDFLATTFATGLPLQEFLLRDTADSRTE